MESQPVTGLTQMRIHSSKIARINTVLSATAFSLALLLGCLLHYRKIVKNEVAEFPEEWFPSVSATIGDWYPERSLFQILCALTSGPRLVCILLQYYQMVTTSPLSNLPLTITIIGFIRTLSCGGWMYITSNDDHDIHDICMITYIVCNVPWMAGCIVLTPLHATKIRRRRLWLASVFFSSIVPLLYYFIQHKVHLIPGAYTRYSFFEWALIASDILFDSVMESEMKDSDIYISVDLVGHSLLQREKRCAQCSAQVSSDGSVVDKQQGEPVPSAPIKVTSNPWRWRAHLSFVSDVYLSYIFWSMFTSLVPTLFWFSVYELGIAGHELAFLTTLSPILFASLPLLRWARSRGGTTTLNALSLMALAAYALPSPLGRLFAVATGTMFGSLRQVSDWSRPEDRGSIYQSTVTVLGLILSSISKQANYSHNPVWPFNDTHSWVFNVIGFLLAIVSTYEQHTRQIWFARRRAGSKMKCADAGSICPGLFSAAIPFGAILFSLHNMLSDSSTLLSWSWTGYRSYRPNGPVPYQHGGLTIIAQAVGLLIPTCLSSSPLALNFLLHPVWFTYGAGCLCLTAIYQDWIGYISGLGLTIFLTSISPLLMRPLATEEAIGKVYFVAMLTYVVMSLANVWTVAYAFVPGGVYLRERSDLVMAAQVACLGVAFNWPKLRPLCSAPSLGETSRSRVKAALALFCTISSISTLYHWPMTPIMPFDSAHRVITTGIWTLHFGLNNFGRDSQRQVSRLISDMKLDVVGLLETDLHRIIYGNRDLTRVAAEELGYFVDIGPTGPKAHTWGAALLSKFPIINSTHHLLPSPHGELAPAIEAVLDVHGTPTTVIVSHNGQEEDPLDRELQSRELARLMANSYPRPVIFLGYVVSKPANESSEPYYILVNEGKVHDIDKDDKDRWCEYILYRGLYRTAYARLSRGSVTDTELQVGKFVLPRHGHNIIDESEPSRYIRSWKEDLPEHLWMPLEYYGDATSGGIDGHYYHVFDTPLYYKLPNDAVI